MAGNGDFVDMGLADVRAKYIFASTPMMLGDFEDREEKSLVALRLMFRHLSRSMAELGATVATLQQTILD
jgi:hypothetical protein